jgi:aminoglycoside 6-adenylyltransferase
LNTSYAQLERDFIAWAETQPAIYAALAIGSRARIVHPADEWSDLDLLVFTTDAAAYGSNVDWLKQFGEIWISVVNHIGPGDPEWLVVYSDGLKIDIAFASIDPNVAFDLQQIVDASPYQDVISRGARVLFDRSLAPTALHLPPIEPAPLPTPDQFTALIHRTWLDAMRVAKFIKRSDLWRAKRYCDGELKQHLLTMLEWHARLIDPSRDVWHDGRFIDEWADPRALARLPHTFAAFNADDLWRALFATLDLFRSLSIEIADRLRFPYPKLIDRRITEWLQSIRDMP